MGKFILKVLLYAACASLLMFGVYLLLPQNRDYAYGRLTVPPQSSLIIGTSRTAQGVDPDVINRRFAGLFELPIYNFAFTMNDSPYGEVYYHSIASKLKVNPHKNGLFILTVDPWALGDFGSQGEARDQSSRLASLHCVSSSPNIEYLLSYNIYQGIYNRYLHLDIASGRYINDKPAPDSLRLKQYIRAKMGDYRNNARSFRVSESRMVYLKKTIELLSKQGVVILVRMPVSEEMVAIEQKIWPDFDRRMETIAAAHVMPYFNFIGDAGRYRTTDGNHLQKDSGTAFTEALCDSIKSEIGF